MKLEDELLQVEKELKDLAKIAGSKRPIKRSVFRFLAREVHAMIDWQKRSDSG